MRQSTLRGDEHTDTLISSSCVCLVADKCCAKTMHLDCLPFANLTCRICCVQKVELSSELSQQSQPLPQIFMSPPPSSKSLKKQEKRDQKKLNAEAAQTVTEKQDPPEPVSKVSRARPKCELMNASVKAHEATVTCDCKLTDMFQCSGHGDIRDGCKIKAVVTEAVPGKPRPETLGVERMTSLPPVEQPVTRHCPAQCLSSLTQRILALPFLLDAMWISDQFLGVQTSTPKLEPVMQTMLFSSPLSL
jgi:hypothetical protein